MGAQVSDDALAVACHHDSKVFRYRGDLRQREFRGKKSPFALLRGEISQIVRRLQLEYPYVIFRSGLSDLPEKQSKLAMFQH